MLLKFALTFLGGAQIEEASAEFVAPLKAAQQQAKARKRAFEKSFVASGGPVRRSTRAAAAATTAKLSKQPEADEDSPETSGDEASQSSEGNEPLAPHEAYDPAGKAYPCRALFIIQKA